MPRGINAWSCSLPTGRAEGGHGVWWCAQTHGYASRVQFRLACTKIPKDVILLEIGPHALMRSPLRQNRCALCFTST